MAQNLDEFLAQRYQKPDSTASPVTEVRSSLMQVQDTDPDAYARATRLAADRSIPVESVLANLPALEKQAEVEAIDPSRLSPGLADWLKDKQNLAVARDDIGVLETIAGGYRAAKRGFAEGIEQTELGVLAFRELSGSATPEEVSRIQQLESTLQARQREAEATGVAGSTGLTALRESTKMVPQLARSFAAAGAVGAGGAATGAGVALAAGQLGPQVALPEEIATVPAGALTGFAIGSRTGMAAESFQQEAGFAWREFQGLKDESGQPMDPSIARTAAYGVGAVNAGLEAFGLSLILKTIPGGDKLAGKFTTDAVKKALQRRTVREALTQVAKRYGTAVTGEALTEMVQETVAILGREIAQASDDGTYAPDDIMQDFSRIGQAGKSAFLGTAVTSFAGATVQAAGEIQQARQAQQTRDVLQQKVDAATQSKLRERLPEKFRELMDRVHKDEPTENLYFNQSAFDSAAERLGTDGRALYGAIVGNTDGYDEAIATGGQVVMPTAAYIDKVAGTAVHDEIAADAKFSPEDLSEREIGEQGSEMQAVNELKDKILSGDQAAMDPETKKVHDHFYGELDRAGTYDRAAVEDQVALATAMVTRLARRSGKSVDELLDRYGLSVRSTLPRILSERPEMIDTQLFPMIERLRAGDIPSERDAMGPTLLDFIRDRGGLRDEGGELSGRDLSLWDKENRKPGQRSIMSPEGRGLDDMAEQAVEAGYMSERDPNALLDLIDSELRGKPAFAMGNLNDRVIAMREALLSLDEYLNREGVDLNEVDNAAVKQLIETGKLPDKAPVEDAGTTLEQDLDPRTAVPRRQDSRAGGRRVSDKRLWDDSLADLSDAELRELAEALRTQALTDKLTGLGSKLAWDRAPRKQFVASLDADGLKWVNDTLGHEAGDRLLAEMGKALGDTGVEAYHVSGDEFWAQSDSEAELRQALETARQAMSDSVLSTDEWSVTGQAFSYGIANNTGQGDESLFHAAEKELQNEKSDRQSRGLRAARAERPAGARQAGEPGYVEPRRADRSAEAGAGSGDGAAEAGKSSRGIGGTPDPVVELNQSSRDVTETPEFKAWFGDSKVVDADGKPLVVYHGTGAEITAFDPSLTGQGNDQYGSGFYFTTSREEADSYQTATLPGKIDKIGGVENPNTVSAYLSIKNPIIIKSSDTPNLRGVDVTSAQAKKIISKAPDILDKDSSPLVDWIDNGGRPFTASHIASVSKNYSNLLAIENDFFRGNATAFREAVRDATGWDGVEVEFDNGKKHYVSWFPEQIKSAFNRGTFDPKNPNILYQAAYHGSPYRFDKFSLEHMGKGEGAQAYGWGLYFAGKREVADYYRRGLADANMQAPDGSIVPVEESYQWVVKLLDEHGGDYEKAKSAMVEHGKTYKYPAEVATRKLNEWEAGGLTLPARGQLYRVEIPSDDKYLLWDKPVPEDVVRKIAEHSVERGLVDDVDSAVEMLTDEFDVSGAKMYQGLSEQLGGDEAASKFLNEIGIPGIKYLDGTSRGAGDGSHNYVLFDDSAIQIVDTFYQQPEPGERLGYIRIAPDRKLSITLLTGANMTTFQHEMAHAYLEMLRDLASGADASSDLKTDWQTLRDWLGIEGDSITVDQHEKFARSWEAYLGEGNAPSIALGRAFARMKSWVLKIYRKLENLRAPLNDEVRGVFDRMLAAEDEIIASRKANGYAAMFANAEEMGVSQREFEAYQRTAQDDLQAGIDRLQRDVMDDLVRERRQWWMEALDKVREEVTAEVDSDPGYQALSFIRRKDGTKLDKKALADEFGEPFVRTLPRGLYVRDGGASPASVAALFEFESTAKMLEALVRADSVPKDKFISAESERRMKEAHGDMMNDGSLPDRATVRIHNEKRADVLAFELRVLKRKQRETAGIVRASKSAGRSEARAAMDAIPETRVFREAARIAVSRKSLRNVKPYNYLLSERKSSREAMAAMARGDFAAAAAHKERELISHYMYIESIKAKKEGEKILEHARKQATAKRQAWLGKAGGDYLEQMNAVLEQYEFRNVSGRVVRRRESLSAFAARKAADGTPIDIPRDVLQRSEIVNYADITMSELRGAYDTMQMIEHLAGLKNELLYNKDRRDFGAVRDEVAKSIRDNNKDRMSGQFAEESGLDAVRRHGRSVMSIVLQPGALARGLEGGDRNGAISRHVVDPVAAAETSFLNRRRDEGDKLAAILDRYTPAERKRMGRERMEVAGFAGGEGPTKWQAISLALNWGNEGNRQAVLDSRDPNGATLWDEGRVNAVLDTLDERDWKFVQDIWSFVNSYWPEISEAQKRRTGLTPKKVDGLPVVTKFGVIQGAYYPLKYESRGNWAVTADEAAQAFDTMRAGRTAHAYTPNGHTKERIGSGGRPVKLDIGVLGQHVDSVLRDLEMADAVNSAWRVLHDRDVVAALAASDNVDALTGFELWLQDTAAGEMVSGNSLMTGLRRVRTGFTAAVMLFNVTNAIMNLTGLGQSAVVVGKGHMAKAAARVMAGPLTGESSVFRQVQELSPMMRIRAETFNKDVNDHIRSLQGQGDWREKMTRWGYVPSMATQLLVDTTTWLGAYERAKSEGLAGDAAIQYADRLTEDAQSSGRFGFRSSFERGTIDRNVRQTELARVWTALLSYMLNKANRAYERTRATDFSSPVQVLSWTSDMLILYTVEAVLVAMIKGNMPDEDDDEDDMLTFAGKETVKAMMGSLPFVREAAAATQGFSGGGVIGSLSDSIGKAYAQAAQGELDASAVKAVNMTLGILFGYPAAQINKFITALSVESEGKDVPAWQYVAGVPLKDR